MGQSNGPDAVQILEPNRIRTIRLVCQAGSILLVGATNFYGVCIHAVQVQWCSWVPVRPHLIKNSRFWRIAEGHVQ